MEAHPRSWTIFCVATFATSVGIAVALAFREPAPEIGTLLLFGSLLVFANHQDVLLPGGIAETPTLMLAMAAVAVFESQSPLLGPMLVGLFGGIYLPQIREREWRKILVNSGMDALAILAAAAAYDALATEMGRSPLALLLLTIPVTLAYVLVSGVLIAVGPLIEGSRRPAELARDLVGATLHAYPFVIFGVFMGRLAIDVGLIVVPLFIVSVVVARETFASYVATKKSHDDTVRILIGALEAKDQYTAGHAERVAMFANYIGLELGLSPKRLERLRLAALMHDVGKLVVPNHLLNKPGKLTEAEFAQVRLHESVSVEILTRIDFLSPVAPSAQSEHTRFRPVADEKGQPIEPHIVAVADAFDAMTSTRSYRKALSQQTAFRELRENAGKQFHPRVVDALIVAIERRGEVYGEGHEVDVHDFAVEPPTAGLGSAGLGDLLDDDTADSPEVSSS